MLVLGLTGGGWNAVDEPQFDLPDEGFDSATLRYASINSASPTPLDINDTFPIGGTIDGLTNFFIVGRRATGCKFMKVELTLKGIASTDRGEKVKISAVANQIQTTNVVVNGEGPFDRLETLEAAPVLEVSYVSLVVPDTSKVGSIQTPPFTYAVRPTFWSAIADPLTHYPFGWVLMSREAECLAGTTVHFVTDRYQYIYEETP